MIYIINPILNDNEEHFKEFCLYLRKVYQELHIK